MVKISVNKGKCIGCGNCAEVCPKSFEMKDGKAHVKKQPEKVSCEKKAEAVCPVQAIKIE